MIDTPLMQKILLTIALHNLVCFIEQCWFALDFPLIERAIAWHTFASSAASARVPVRISWLSRFSWVFWLSRRTRVLSIWSSARLLRNWIVAGLNLALVLQSNVQGLHVLVDVVLDLGRVRSHVLFVPRFRCIQKKIINHPNLT